MPLATASRPPASTSPARRPDLRAILFDVNGTIVDIETDEWSEDAYRVLAHLLTYQGVSLHAHEIRDLYYDVMEEQFEAGGEEFAEFDAVGVWRTVLEQHGSARTAALPVEKMAHLPVFMAEVHRAISRKRLRAFPDVHRVLETLAKKYILAVVTDAQSAYANAELHEVGLRDFFRLVAVSGDYGYRKPDGRLFAGALQALGVRPDQAVYVGNDMYRDVYGAHQAGMKAVLFSSQYGEKHHLDTHLDTVPDSVIRHFGQLLDAIERLAQA